MVAVSDTGGPGSIEMTAAGAPRQVAAVVDIASVESHAAVRFERTVDAARAHAAAAAAAPTSRQAVLRLVVVRVLVERIASSLHVGILSGG